MRNRDINRHLTGRWAGFSFVRGHLMTPEGRAIDPWTLRYWSLTCCIAQEWKAMRDEANAVRRPVETPNVVYLREVLAGARERVKAAGR